MRFYRRLNHGRRLSSAGLLLCLDRNRIISTVKRFKITKRRKNMDMNMVGNQIAYLRKEKGLTQTELGERLNLSFQAVSKWERGGSHT